jgi:hypothetical protein
MGPGSGTGCPQQPEVANSAKARDGFALVQQPERDQPDVAATVGALKTTPLAPGRVDFRPRPGPTQLAAQMMTQCLGSTERTRAMRQKSITSHGEPFQREG